MVYMSLATDDWEPELLQAVGRFVIAFGQLEHVLKLALKRINGRSYEEGMSLAEEIRGNPALCKRIKDDYSIRAMNQGNENFVEQLLNWVVGLAQFRNFLVHGYWHEVVENQERRIALRERVLLPSKAMIELQIGQIVLARQLLDAVSKQQPDDPLPSDLVSWISSKASQRS